MTFPIGDNLIGNEIPGQPGVLSAFSENDLGMVNARRNFLFNKDLDLGRPGDASYVPFAPDVSQSMMSSGSNSGRGIPTATSDSIMRAVGEGMGKNLNDVMMQTQGIQNKYGDPNDKSIQQIMAEFNANESNTGILNKVSESKLRDEAIKQRIADKTFVPMKKAQAYEPPKQTVADRKGYTPKPVAKPKVKVNYNRNKPVAVKSKPVRTPTPKPTRTTGSRGGRGNVGARRRLTGGR
jgi:hypothetical protein